MRQVADRRHRLVVRGGRESFDAGAERLPEVCQLFRGIGRRVVFRREDDEATLEQVGRTMAHARLLAARHRMAAQERRARTGSRGRQLPTHLADNRTLRAARVGDDRMGRRGLHGLNHMQRYLLDRRADDHPVGVGDTRREVRGELRDGAAFQRFPQRCLAPANAHHTPRKAPLPQAHADGSSNQSYANDRDGVPAGVHFLILRMSGSPEPQFPRGQP
jgi:hypothetical protein